MLVIAVDSQTVYALIPYIFMLLIIQLMEFVKYSLVATMLMEIKKIRFILF